jgi:membrane fusion protein (multidrug efflux system)
MNQVKLKTKLLRLIWSAVPWMLVVLMLLFMFRLCSRIDNERDRLEKAKQEAVKTDKTDIKVITLTIVPRELKDKINLPGYIEPYEDLWVKAEVSGQVIEVLIDEGAAVKKGQVLVVLDDRDYRLRLNRVEASYKLAKLEYDRIAALDRKKITAANRLDEIEAQLNDVTAQKNEAQLALERTRIKAPIDGVINELRSKSGNFVGIGEEIAQILQTSKVKVSVGIPESDVASFFDLKTATVIIEALGKKHVTGKKIFLSRQPRSLARLFDLELMITNKDGRILPGMFARVELVKEIHKSALVIPLYAVITQGDEHFVYIEKNGVAKKRAVEIGILENWQVQVVSGLQVDDNVIVVGHRFLDEDEPVEVIKNVIDPQEILSL